LQASLQLALSSTQGKIAKDLSKPILKYKKEKAIDKIRNPIDDFFK